MPDRSKDAITACLRIVEKTCDVVVDGPSTYVVPRKGDRIACRVDEKGGSAAKLLTRLYFDRYGKLLPRDAARGVCQLILAGALHVRRERVYVRMAWSEGRVVVDLGEPSGRVVKIDAGGWRVAKRTSVVFRRPGMIGPLPEPNRDGDIALLRKYFAVSDELWPLVLGWMVTAYLPEEFHPILYVVGPHASGKSSVAWFAQAMVDPHHGQEEWGVPRPQDWPAATQAVYVLPLGNISSIREDMSNMLCRAVTGGLDVRRQLWTDDGTHVARISNPITITALPGIHLRPDLASRMVQVSSEPLRRKVKQPVLRPAFLAEQPRMLGALLDLVSEVLRSDAWAEPESDVRMAGFATVLDVLDRINGSSGAETYRRTLAGLSAEIVHGDPLLETVYHFARNHRNWTGRATELHDALTSMVDHPGRYWPKNGSRLSAVLETHSQDLAQVGVEVVRNAKGGKGARSHSIRYRGRQDRSRRQRT